MRDKEAVIIEASVLLITLMFIILPVYITRMPTAQAQLLNQFSSAIGFVFTFAALLAALRMFGAPQVCESLELVFFGVGLFLLAVMFFLGAQTEFRVLFVFLAVISAGLVLWESRQEIVSWTKRRRVQRQGSSLASTILPQVTLLRALLLAFVVGAVISGVIEFFVHRMWSDIASRYGLSVGMSLLSYLFLFAFFRSLDVFSFRDLLKSWKDALTWFVLSALIILLVAGNIDMLVTMFGR